MGEVITFTSGKGGVGKTTTTANVGAGLSLLDKKVVLVDTDIGLRNLDVVMGLENRILYNLVDCASADWATLFRSTVPVENSDIRYGAFADEAE